MLYIWCMKKENVNGVDAQGAVTPSVETVKEWLKNDIARSLSCLNAIYSDPDLLEHIAVFMRGRLENHREQERIKSNPQ